MDGGRFVRAGELSGIPAGLRTDESHPVLFILGASNKTGITIGAGLCLCPSYWKTGAGTSPAPINNRPASSFVRRSKQSDPLSCLTRRVRRLKLFLPSLHLPYQPTVLRRRLRRAARTRSFDNFKLEIDRLAANHVTKISLPKSADEAETGIAVGKVDEEFYSERAPEFEQRDADDARA